MQIQLIIEQPGRRVFTSVLVENTMLVGACVAMLATSFGYQAIDSTSVPISYRLFTASGEVLPDDQSLADLQISAGTHLLFHSVEARNPTIPIRLEANAALMQDPPVRRRRTRRSILVMGSVLSCCALTGLGSGWIVVSHGLLQSAFGASKGTALIRNPSAGPAPRAMTHFTGHQQTVRAVTWSPDGTLLASGGDDGQTLVWTPAGVIQQRIAHQASVQSLAWSPESQRLVVGAGSQVEFLTVTGSQLAMRHHAAQVNSVAWSRQGSMFAASGSSDTQAIVWETNQYQAQTVFRKHTTAIEAVTFSGDGQAIASSSHGGAVRVWAAASGGELHPFYLDARIPVPTLAFAPSAGSLLAVGGSDHVIRLWNGLQCQQTGTSDQGRVCVDSPKRLHLASTPRALAWSPDSRYLVSGGDDGTLVLWSPTQSQTPAFLSTVQSNTPIQGVAWSPDGKRLATASGAMVVIWEVTP